MTELGGFQDRVARIDLSTESISYEPIDDEDAKYIGARGLGVKYVFEQGRTSIRSSRRTCSRS